MSEVLKKSLEEYTGKKINWWWLLLLQFWTKSSNNARQKILPESVLSTWVEATGEGEREEGGRLNGGGEIIEYKKPWLQIYV